jgi:hypothetical protein
MLFSYACVSMELFGPSAKAAPGRLHTGRSSLIAGLVLLVSGRLGLLLEYLMQCLKMNAVFATDLAFILAFHQNPPATNCF